MKQDMILILDLGSEENPRLAREIRALGVYSEIHPHDITADELAALPNVKGTAAPTAWWTVWRSTPPRRSTMLLCPCCWPTTRAISPGPRIPRPARKR